MRAGHARLLADSLRADDDVGQLEVDVGKRGQEPGVEPGRALVALPPVRRACDLVDAVLGQRREEAGDVAVVLGDRVLLPELADRLDLGRVDLPFQQFADIHQRQYSQAVSHLSAVRAQNRRTLGLVLALTVAITAVEVVGGLLTGSLALLADAVHMLSDNVALGTRPRRGLAGWPAEHAGAELRLPAGGGSRCARERARARRPRDLDLRGGVRQAQRPAGGPGRLDARRRTRRPGGKPRGSLDARPNRAREPEHAGGPAARDRPTRSARAEWSSQRS